MGGNYHFRTRARVIEQLGYQLIKSESIALLELIKNSYDADATFCKIKLKNCENPDKGEIIILDNGEGMDNFTLENAWLEIGTSFKDDLEQKEETKLSTKFNRRRLGEKGIGRLGVHRLGKVIEIITRKKGKDEYILILNWDDIENHKYIEDVKINVLGRKPVLFKASSGTQIKITNLRIKWTKKMVHECHRIITALNSPFESIDNFKTEFLVDKHEWLTGLLSFKDIEMYKLFSFYVEMKGNLLRKFKYTFSPWEVMTKLESRNITIKELKTRKRMMFKDGKDYKDINLDKFKIGTIIFRGIIFDRDTKILKLGLQEQEKKGLKTYLDTNGGIRIYKDNMRIMDYGEPGNDWLDLGGRRINMPAKRISNNIILGAVFLDRDSSTDLEEKANREGFIENEAYDEFVRSVLFVIERIESFRKIDKDILRKYYGEKKIIEPVITSITELKEIIEENVKEDKIKLDIIKYIERVEKEYIEITDSLIKSAGAGLNLIMVIHEMQQIIRIIMDLIAKKGNSEFIKKQVEKLSILIEGYSILIKKSERKSRNLKGIINNTLFLLESRFNRHKITINKAYDHTRVIPDAYCSEDHLTNALMNIFDNSIFWFYYAKVKKPEIYIDISDNFPGFRSILIADNGPGFTLPVTEIVKPFVTDKPDGMGIGLHLTEQIMISLGGKLLFPQDDDYFEFPEKFKKGAKLCLALKKGG